MKIIFTLLALALPVNANPDPVPSAEKESAGETYLLLSKRPLSKEELAELEQFKQMREEIAWFEAQTVPRQGTSHEEVEKKFGSGRPVRVSSSPFVAPGEVVTEDSPRRHYTFTSTEILDVRYDKDWKVIHANYMNPFQIINGPFTTAVDVEWQRWETPRRLEQMQQIVEEYKKRFKTTEISEGEYVEQLRQEIARLEKHCTPATGTTRQEVEKKFGAGRPAFSGKVPPKEGISENSLQRSYEFASPDALFVVYDKQWKLRWAHFHDPFSVKGRPFGTPVPIEEQRQEAEARLEQMKRIFGWWASFGIIQ